MRKIRSQLVLRGPRAHAYVLWDHVQRYVAALRQHWFIGLDGVRADVATRAPKYFGS
jgi:hypothetical protein